MWGMRFKAKYEDLSSLHALNDRVDGGESLAAWDAKSSLNSHSPLTSTNYTSSRTSLPSSDHEWIPRIFKPSQMSSVSKLILVWVRSVSVYLSRGHLQWAWAPPHKRSNSRSSDTSGAKFWWPLHVGHGVQHWRSDIGKTLKRSQIESSTNNLTSRKTENHKVWVHSIL